MTTILDLPCGINLTTERFRPIRSRNVARMESRRTETDIRPDFYWVAEYSSQSQKLAHIAFMDSFFMEIDDGALFRAFDMTRPRPLDYLRGPLSGDRAGGGAFDGTATLQAIVNSQSIRVSGLPAGFQLRNGDRVEIRASALIVSLHMITADAKANSSGVVTLPIRYALPVGLFAAGATVNFEKPAFLAQVDPGSEDVGRKRGSRGISFSAQEMFPGGGE